MIAIFKFHLALQTRIKLLALIILLAGVASSCFIYQNAKDISPGYDLAVSRNYLSNLGFYDGIMNILFTDLKNWFCGLWQGKDLAFTIAYLTVIVSVWLLYIAKLYSSDPADVDDHMGAIE